MRISNYGADTSGSAGLIGYIKDIEFWNDTTTATQDDKATLLTDSLGSDGNATNNGADLDTTNEKLGTGCLDFNGSSDNINASNLQTNTAMTTKGTISMWVNFDDLTTGRKIWSIGDANANSFIYVEMESNGTLVAQCRLASTNQWKCNTSSGIVSTSGWYLVTITHNGTEPKIYVNGTEDTTFTVTTDKTKWANMTGLDEFYVGKGRYNGSDDGFLDGKTDDIGIWNDALIVGTDENTADSIKWLYNTGTGRLASTIPSGLRAYYNCDSATTNNNAVGSLLPENTIFNETDTYKQYWLQDNQWWYTNGTMVDTDLYLWYDASDLSTITKDGSNQVSQWNDKSGGGRHLTASGTGTDGMPLWVSAGQNGNNEIDFVNSKKMSKSGIELESTRTTFIVCKAGDNSGTDKSPLGFTDGGSYSADFYCPRIYTGGNQFYFNEIGTSEFTETGIINTWRQWTSLCKSGGSALRMGGVEKATNTTTGTDTPDAMNVGNNHLLNSDFNRPIGEIIIYNRELTTSEIESVEAYLKAKWGTP